uniref:Uncharacterized protein n=1 Tax=Mucochytrium quahogii TaxID=96639 RepID=A0A7S2SL97_9STRA
MIDDMEEAKSVRPTMPVMAYLNSGINFPQFHRLFCSLQKAAKELGHDIDHPNLHNSYHTVKKNGRTFYDCNNLEGEPLYKDRKNIDLFDFRKEYVRDKFLEYVQLIKDSGFEGLFLDRGDMNCIKGRGCKKDFVAEDKAFPNRSEAMKWDRYHVQVLRDSQAIFGDEYPVIANNIILNGVGGRQHERFLMGEWHMDIPRTINELLNAGKKGLVVQAFANPCSHDDVKITLPSGETRPQYTGRFMRINTLAAFFIGQCKHAYYSCSLGFIPDNAWHQKQPGNSQYELDDLWAGNTFFSEYSRRIGAPTGLPLHWTKYQNGAINHFYYREFVSGVTGNKTKVWFHVKKMKRKWFRKNQEFDLQSVILWGDGGPPSTSDERITPEEMHKRFKVNIGQSYMTPVFKKHANCNA